MKTSKKILLVDDDIDIITVSQSILEKEGYTVISANNKKEALEKIKSEKPDLAVLDVMMTTQFEGFELAKELSENPEIKGIPYLMMTSVEVLVTTNSSVQEMAREFRKNPKFKDLEVLLVKDIYNGSAGVDYCSGDGRSIWFPVGGFLNKPVDSKKLVPEVKRLLGE